jgi:hypothetical protein
MLEERPGATDGGRGELIGSPFYDLRPGYVAAQK